MGLAQELEERGFVHQMTAATLEEIVEGPKRTIYHGIDPSADSATVGNFVVWMLLRLLAEHGHTVIFLVGGGTGMIGDPKPDVERALTPPEIVTERVQKLQLQAKQIFGDLSVTFVNNHDWLGELELIPFLRDVGKHFTVNELIKKDAIATRLGSEEGISYTEFAYPLLQAYDYLTLHKMYGCDVQVGGSDQWGNIVAGVDLVRRVEQHTVYAFTVPLVIDKATGKKFGKSEGNAVWLDAEKTSPYEFYQFWLNTSDESVVDFLKLYTRISLEEIREIEKAFRMNPGERSAQQRLAGAVTEIVHGEELARTVGNVSRILFGSGTLEELSDDERRLLLENAPLTKVKLAEQLVDVLVRSELASSKREARTFIESGAVILGGEKVTQAEAVVDARVFINGVTLLKRGKKQLVVLELE